MEIGQYRFDPRQDIEELDWLVEHLKNAGVKRFLEIGSRFGGCLWRVGEALPKGSLIASVDMPADENGRKSLIDCINALHIELGHDSRVFLGNSRDQNIIDSVSAFAPFDAVFIDADHSLAGVTADWQNYGGLAPIVAFHDIAWNPPKEKRKGIYVSELWNKLKARYRYAEHVAPNSYKGIGVLWR